MKRFGRLWGVLNVVAALAFVAVGSDALAQIEVDPRFPSYKPVPGISGKLKSVGSDTMNNLMTFWAEGFRQYYPGVQIEIEGKGSSTAPPALIAGTAQFGPMSREMKPSEVDAFEKRFGYKPTAIPTAIDLLAVYVHRDNPLSGLTLPQLDAIFSKTRRSGYPRDIRFWGDLGLTGEWAQRPISLYGRNSASGTYGFFKEHVLLGGDFKDEVKEQPGSSSVVQGVGSDRFAIGYSGMGYKTADVRVVPLASAPGQPFVECAPEHAYSGDYPLTRILFVYINYRPGSQLDPLRREFVRYILSKDGQAQVIKDGYFPITWEMAREALKSVGIEPK
ncbi:MAG: PstS family phosphate ABC transporter substrate-binding protein [Thermoguttaceae bacterium]|nr:PstS family phosphate ABC transporter substrate-binding protein [Thermoguttaceae bacterium]MDW8078355.1 PstS family phosphate ABC transporter substrate-binding protein [Thermoguttaceae bacterium]